MMDSTITPQKLFETGEFRDIETANKHFVLLKKVETLEGIIEDARKILGKKLLSEPVLDRAIRSGTVHVKDYRQKSERDLLSEMIKDGTVQIHDFRRKDRGDNL